MTEVESDKPTTIVFGAATNRMTRYTYDIAGNLAAEYGTAQGPSVFIPDRVRIRRGSLYRPPAEGRAGRLSGTRPQPQIGG